MPTSTPMEWLVKQTHATAGTVGRTPAREYWRTERAVRAPTTRDITTEDLLTALKLGMQDFARARTDVAFVCLIYPILGLFLAVLTARGGAVQLLFPVASGFALVGPFAALGLYEISRRREAYGDASWSSAFCVFQSPNIWRIFLLGGGLVALFAVWLVAATGIYDVTLGPLPPASLGAFVSATLTTPAGWAMIALGFAVGALFAVSVLAVSVISFPMLLDRPVTLRTAIRTSVYAVRRNPRELGLWGVMMAAGLFLGSLPCFLGLILVLPVLGHATWHLYRRVVRR